MPAHRLKFEDSAEPGAKFHLVRANLDRSRPKALHNHDFYELVWVQNGVVKHHMADFTEELREGDVLFVRPDDVHALQGKGDEPLVVSLLFDRDLIDDMGRRLEMDRFFWSQSTKPDRHHRDMRSLTDLNRAAMRLERAKRSGLEAESFLVPLLASLLDKGPEVPMDAPDWLRDACSAAQDPSVFRDGAAGLVRVAGRAHPHVSRTMRKFMDLSPSDYVNRIRMTHAARRLTGTPDSLAEIAADCGIPNLSHFHKLFRSYHSETPHKYRKNHQREVVQPTMA